MYLKPADEGDDYAPYGIVADRQAPQREALYDEQVHHLDLNDGMRQGISPWVVHDYLETLEELADELRISSLDCAWRFGRISLPELRDGERWRFHPALGFSKARRHRTGSCFAFGVLTTIHLVVALLGYAQAGPPLRPIA